MEVVLRFAQVQGEGVVEKTEARQGLLQAADGPGCGLEVAVEVVGSGVVGGTFGQQSPLLALAPPVEQVGAGQDELVAVVAVKVPGAGAAVDDGLEGAETALGGGAAAGQVDRQSLGLRASERGGVAGEEVAGMSGAGSGDPHVLEDVVQVRLGQVDVVLGHAVGDLTEVTADVRQARAVPQQPGGQRVPGLVGDVVTAEVKLCEPMAEAGVEPGVGQSAAAVGVEDVGEEQGQMGPLGSSGRAACVPVGVVGQSFGGVLRAGEGDGRGCGRPRSGCRPWSGRARAGAVRRSGRCSPGGAG